MKSLNRSRSPAARALHEAELVAHDLGEPFRIELELQHDLGPAVVEPVERDDTAVLGSLTRPPGDALVGMLLGDLRVPLALDSGDVGDPVQVGVVGLADLLHAFHELRKGLELGPLVVGRADRDVDLD